MNDRLMKTEEQVRVRAKELLQLPPEDLITKYMFQEQEIERLNKTLEDIDTYIHLWELEEIGEKTMLILNDILLIKNGMSDKVVRLKDSDEE